MENVMELYYFLKNIESNFENLYVQYKNKNILDYCQLTEVKYNHIVYLMMKIEIEKKFLNPIYKYYIDKFLITHNHYNYTITISFPLVGPECLENLVSIYYNDNLISIYCNDNPSISKIYYCRYKRSILFNSNGIKILYSHCCKSNMLIIILSAQRKFSIKQRLPPEMYNFIYNEFLEYMMNF